MFAAGMSRSTDFRDELGHGCALSMLSSMGGAVSSLSRVVMAQGCPWRKVMRTSVAASRVRSCWQESVGGSSSSQEPLQGRTAPSMVDRRCKSGFHAVPPSDAWARATSTWVRIGYASTPSIT